MDPIVPLPLVVTVVAALCGTIGMLFKIVMDHHREAVKEFQAERAENREERKAFLDRMDGIEKAITRTTRVELMRFSVSPHVAPEIKEAAREMLEETKPK